MPEPIPGSSNTPILLASGNPAKQRSLRWLLEGLPLAPVAPLELGLESVPEETGDNHETIARQKALEWSRAGSMLAIASDGGLVIPALGSNWESIFTHRFAGPAADDAARQDRLLELMRPYRGQEREASWVEALAIADRGDVRASWELTGATGVIGESLGDSPQVPGFWVFSLWYFPQYGKTYKELSLQERESLGDHWGLLQGLVQGFFRDLWVSPG